AEILKRDAGVLDSDPPTPAVEKIETLVREVVPVELCGDTVRAAAALAFTVGLEHPDVAFGSMDPRQVGSEIVSAWRAYFSAQALRHPTIVVVEDVQWAEPAMLDLLEGLAERAEGPLLFLCPARPELTARRPGWGGGRWNFSALLLEPLTADEAGRLLDSILPGTGILAPPRERILERTGGNPFFIEEVVHRLIDHVGVGEWIEQSTGERQREVAELLAYHFEEASAGAASALPSAHGVRAPLAAKAFRYSLLASEELRARMVLDKAQRLASSALSAAATDAERSLAHEALGRALYQDSRGDEAWEALRSAADLQAAAPNPDRAVLVRQALAA